MIKITRDPSLSWSAGQVDQLGERGMHQRKHELPTLGNPNGLKPESQILR